MVLTFEQLLREQTDTARLITNFLTNTDKTNKQKRTLGFLNARLVILNTYYESVVNTHRSLVRMAEFETSEYNTEDRYNLIVEEYVDVKVELETRIQALQLATTSATKASSAQATAPTLDAENMMRQFQLPKVDLPKFDGDPLKWESFRDLFKSLVIDVPGLSNCQRLLYLQSRLSGEAADLIKNTPITDNSFSGAWEDLEARYGNPRIISSYHIKALFSIPPALKSSPPEIKRLIDAFRQAIRAFTALKKPVAHWDEFFVYLLVQKLDRSSRIVWETSLSDSKEIPTFQQLVDFLENRVHALEFAYTDTNPSGVSSREPQKSKPTTGSAKWSNRNALAVTKADDKQTTSTNKLLPDKVKTSNSNRKRCLICAEDHHLNYCPEFKGLSPSARWTKVVDLKACLNCLRAGHSTTACPSTSRCLSCGQGHHSLLHTPSGKSTAFSQPQVNANKTGVRSSVNVGCCSLSTVADRAVFIASARVLIINDKGESVVARALLDTCAEASLITEATAKALNMTLVPSEVPVSGVQGCPAGHSSHAVSFRLGSPRDSTFNMNVQALVLPRITNRIPSSPIVVKPWSHLYGLPLADPDYAKPGEIDLLIGADLSGYILLDESRKGSIDEPVARLSPFGWVIMGPAEFAHPSRLSRPLIDYIHFRTIFSEEMFWDDTASPINQKVICHCATEPSNAKSTDCVYCDLQKFWEIEEISSPTPLSEEDQQCENFYANTVCQTETGRYVVRLPFKLDPAKNLTPDASAAAAVLVSNERKFAKNNLLKTEYSSFMDEYSSLGHMSPSNSADFGTFLPHHAVWRTVPRPKLRVVFNASHLTSTGKSLNDCLMAGPKLQSDLATVITRSRFFKVFFTADIVKMFRQIWVDEEDTRWQQVLWRSFESEQMEAYALKTVTYGTSCAPYLALRTLVQLARDNQTRFPLGAKVVLETSYVDDFLAGGDDLTSALKIKNQLVNLLQAGGFELSKWASNFNDLVPQSSTDSKLLQEDEVVSTLGLSWDPKDDSYNLKVNTDSLRKGQITKRTVLSDIARLFDPLGWFAPTLISAKVLIQKIWLIGLDWDQPLTPELSEQWTEFRSVLPSLEEIRIPRWLGTSSNSQNNREIHVFCDASEQAYATTVYLRQVGESCSIVNLLVAKSKVAPIKTVSIPRLELCSTVLAAKLVVSIRSSLDLAEVPIYAYSDSQVTLAWIQSHASKWSTFVAHRVSKVQSLVPPECWRHVRSAHNPADLATRGISPSELKSSKLWWNGPPFLAAPGFTPNTFATVSSTKLEERQSKHPKVIALETIPESDFLFELCSRFSNFSRMLRVVVLIKRVIPNVPKLKQIRELRKAGNCVQHSVSSLTTVEMAEARRQLLYISQAKYFPEEMKLLCQGKVIGKKSTLRKLRPFVDDQSLLRIGGRLQCQEVLSFDEKHPIILSKHCPLAKLLVEEAHRKTLHGGPQLMISHISRKYWITYVQSLVTAVANECVTCTRYNAKTLTQIMGNLPKDRIHAARPFLASGVDYAGPVYLRTTRGRGHKSYKGYICLFVCMASKAIHLEAVSDLTSQAFIAAYRRFISRRGHCQSLYSDQGTNFRGADKELQQMFNEASKFYQEACAYLLNDNTDWTFIPPLSPHMGGLWEAGVKSVKHHLRRVLGSTTLTFEEMSTLLCQIEACLNSRPLTSLSKNPDDLAPLTPGHFLVGHALTTIPEPGFVDFDKTPTNRYRLISKIKDDFWRRWQSEYLRTLQSRTRWQEIQDPLLLNSMVLITDENTPPAKWPLGRIVGLHPGKDGLTRTVTVRTAVGDRVNEYVRPIVKLCLLPVAPC